MSARRKKLAKMAKLFKTQFGKYPQGYEEIVQYKLGMKQLEFSSENQDRKAACKFMKEKYFSNFHFNFNKLETDQQVS